MFYFPSISRKPQCKFLQILQSYSIVSNTGQDRNAVRSDHAVLTHRNVSFTLTSLGRFDNIFLLEIDYIMTSKSLSGKLCVTHDCTNEINIIIITYPPPMNPPSHFHDRSQLIS